MKIIQHDLFIIASVFAAACALALFLTPYIIRTVNHFKLLDAPDLRKEHKFPTPTMGGISFTIVFLVLSIFWKDSIPLTQFLTIVFCVLVLFPIGMIDDTKGISALKKLLIELALGYLLVFAGLGIRDLHGIFGIHDLNIWQQYGFNMILMAGLINAFNLIDGINGLAGGLGLINSLFLSFIFYQQGNAGFMLLAISFAGALLGFLRFNFNKAKIFMGDTGSLHLGLMMTVMGTEAINGSRFLNFHHSDMTMLVSAIWLIPVFDTMRVFSVRMIKGKGPFTPDKSHVHHLLIKSGLNHVKASVSLYSANILLIISVIYSPYINPTFNFLLIFAEGILLIELLTFNRLHSFYLKSKNAFIKTSHIIYGQLYLNK